MSTKVKGFLRGLRYMSHMFDEKEQEMQIGCPTDVKHVAHVGWDGPSANTPSWMNEFKTSSELPDGSSSSTEVKSLATQPPAEDAIQKEQLKQRSMLSSTGANSLSDSPARKSSRSDVPKHSKRQTSSSTLPLDSPQNSDAPKHSRRHRSANSSLDSPKVELLGGSQTSRQLQNTSAGAQSPSNGQPSVPKHSRARKSKGSSGDGSSRSSRSKDKNASEHVFPFSDPGPGGSESVRDRKTTASHLSSVLEAYEEER